VPFSSSGLSSSPVRVGEVNVRASQSRGYTDAGLWGAPLGESTSQVLLLDMVVRWKKSREVAAPTCPLPRPKPFRLDAVASPARPICPTCAFTWHSYKSLVLSLHQCLSTAAMAAQYASSQRNRLRHVRKS
jgi:hypothetical protein